MKLQISKNSSGQFEVWDYSPGSPPVGRGRSMIEAIGSYFHNNQTKLNIHFEVHDTAKKAVMDRFKREVAKR